MSEKDFKPDFNIFDTGTTAAKGLVKRNDLVQNAFSGRIPSKPIERYSSFLDKGAKGFSALSGLQSGAERYGNSATTTKTGRWISTAISGVVGFKISPMKLFADNVVGAISHGTGIGQSTFLGRTPSKYLTDTVDQGIHKLETYIDRPKSTLKK